MERIIAVGLFVILLLAAIGMRFEEPAGAPPNKEYTLEEVEAYVDSYYQTNGVYPQLSKGQTIQANKKLPDNMEVHIYESPDGRGYQVLQYEEFIEPTATSSLTKIRETSVAFGPESASRNYVKEYIKD